MKYPVPRANREYACWPEVQALPDLVETNRALLSNHRFTVLDLPATQMRTACRREMREAARSYAIAIGFEPAEPAREFVIATGHQPELVHAGVWIKNFLAARLAAAVGGSSLNLIVDNDVPKHLGLVMPLRECGSARRVEVELAGRRPETAFEEYPPALDDPAYFRESAAEVSHGTPFESNAVELAGRLAGANGTGVSIADVISAARISYERECRVANAELPVSRLADTPCFGIFALSLAAEAGRFAAVHNAALAFYRREHRIRSSGNPIPDLAVKGSRVETPFWIWREGQRRGRLFVEAAGDDVILLADADEVARASVATADAAAGAWRRLVSEGLRVRPRALSTTIFMRLFAADLFIHGIGGAKYDEVTDHIIGGFYQVEPPPFVTISATLTLPWDFTPAEPSDEGLLKRRLRDIQHNPQRLLCGAPFGGEGTGCDAEARELVAEKWRLVTSRPADRDQRRDTWERIRGINSLLAAGLRDAENETVIALDEAHRRRDVDAILFGREYPVFLTGAHAAAQFYDEICAPLVRSPLAAEAAVRSCPSA